MNPEFQTPGGTVLPLLPLTQRKKLPDPGPDGKPQYETVVKLYLQVQHRLVWFREEHPDWCITTAILESGVGYAIVQATVSNENGVVVGTGMKREDLVDWKDYLEKAETGAIGRALAVAGYGTQFAAELMEGDDVVDAPAPSRPSSTAVQSPSAPAPPPEKPVGRANEPMSAGQKDYLTTLIVAKLRPPSAMELDLVDAINHHFSLDVKSLTGVTKWTATALIDKLKAMQRPPEAQPF